MQWPVITNAHSLPTGFQQRLKRSQSRSIPKNNQRFDREERYAQQKNTRGRKTKRNQNYDNDEDDEDSDDLQSDRRVSNRTTVLLCKRSTAKNNYTKTDCFLRLHTSADIQQRALGTLEKTVW